MAHYRGKDVIVSFDATNVTSDGRSVSVEQTADTLDDTVYGQDERTKVASLEDGSFSLELLDTTGAWSDAWSNMPVGATGTIVVQPEGAGTGKRQLSFTGVITGRSLELPYEDLAKLSISGEISGVVDETDQT